MKIFIAIISAVLILAILFFILTPLGRATWNTWFHEVQKADDDTSYTTRKKVEDTCRAMIASYNSDKLKYATYSASTKENEQEWGEQAKIRANETASTYNNYILKNRYIWKDNIPPDIYLELEIIQ